MVAITVGFANTIARAEWFTAHRWPTIAEWHSIALLLVGIAAIIESWDGYFASIANKAQRTIARFIIDIAVSFAYMFLLLSSTYLPFFVCVMSLIFVLYVLWDVSLLIEYRQEYFGNEIHGAGSDRSVSAWSERLARRIFDSSSSLYTVGITLSWAFYFLSICLLTVASHKDMAFEVACFALYGLVMYGADKNRRFSVKVRVALISIAVVVFAVAAVIV